MQIGDRVSHRWIANYIMEAREVIGTIVAIKGDWIVIEREGFAEAYPHMSPFLIKPRREVSPYEESEDYLCQQIEELSKKTT